MQALSKFYYRPKGLFKCIWLKRTLRISCVDLILPFSYEDSEELIYEICV